MATFEENLHQLVLNVCDQENIFLEDLTVMGGGSNRLVKITVDTESGITLSQCQVLSKKISDVFFIKDIFSSGYQIEVSSPGTSKPLEKAYEFTRNVGKELHINYRDGKEIKSITGELISFVDNKITINLKNEELSIPLEDIEEAKIKLKW